MNEHPSLTEVILPEALKFHRAFQSLLLATANAAGNPNASYAPYVADTGGYYIYVSELAAHSGNLRCRPVASVLFIEDELTAHHLFARKRLTLECRAEPVERGTVVWTAILDRFAEMHGTLMATLRDLQDFQLFRLTPVKAVYVRGFAQAYELTGEQLQQIRHINDKGHRPGSGAMQTSLAGAEELS